jgi:putative N6-adenine-specific DNA methylase
VFEASSWDSVRSEERKGEQQPKLHLYGSDTEPKALNAARRNLAEAGVERWVSLERGDILERTAPARAGVMVANPPYGERMGSAGELAAFYPKLGDALKRNFAGWRCYFFTADLRLPKLIRLQPSRRIALWNGALECRLYEFTIVSGSHRR